MKIDIPDYLAYPMLAMLATVTDREAEALRVLKVRRNLNLAEKAAEFSAGRQRHESALLLYQTIEAAIKDHGPKVGSPDDPT